VDALGVSQAGHPTPDRRRADGAGGASSQQAVSLFDPEVPSGRLPCLQYFRSQRFRGDAVNSHLHQWSGDSTGGHADAGWTAFTSYCQSSGIDTRRVTDDQLADFIAGIKPGSAKNYRSAVTRTLFLAHGTHQTDVMPVTNSEVAAKRKQHTKAEVPTLDMQPVWKWVEAQYDAFAGLTGLQVRDTTIVVLRLTTGARSMDITKMAHMDFERIPARASLTDATEFALVAYDTKEMLLRNSATSWSGKMWVKQPKRGGLGHRSYKKTSAGFWIDALQKLVRGTPGVSATPISTGRYNVYHWSLFLVTHPTTGQMQVTNPAMGQAPRKTALHSDTVSKAVKRVFEVTDMIKRYPQLQPRHMRHWFATTMTRLLEPEGAVTRRETIAHLRHAGAGTIETYQAAVVHPETQARWDRLRRKSELTVAQLLRV